MSRFALSHEETGPDQMTFNVVGEIDQHSYDMLDQALEDAIDEGIKFVTIDLSRVTYISSAGIGVLVGAMSRLESEAEGSLVLASPTPNVKHVLDTMGFTEVFKIISAPDQNQQASGSMAHSATE